MIELKKYFESVEKDCIRCNLCEFFQRECFQHDKNYGDSAKSVLKIIDGNDEDNKLSHSAQIFAYSCCLCDKCTKDCPAEIDAREFSTNLRVLFALLHPERVSTLRDFRMDLKWNHFSVLQMQEMSASFELFEHTASADNDKCRTSSLENASASSDTLFFPGCMLLTYAPELVNQTSELLAKNGVANVKTKLCCGNPLLSVGLQEKSDTYAEKLLGHIQKSGFSRVITACPNCFRQLTRYIDATGIVGLEVEALPQTLAELGVKIVPTEKFAASLNSFHDPCPDRLNGVFAENVRKLMGDFTTKELANNRRDTRCCGNGGVASYFNPALYMKRCESRLKDFQGTKADNLICSCLACVHTFRYASPETAAYHYLELLFDTKIDWIVLYERDSLIWERSPLDQEHYKKLYEDMTEIF